MRRASPGLVGDYHSSAGSEVQIIREEVSLVAGRKKILRARCKAKVGGKSHETIANVAAAKVSIEVAIARLEENLPSVIRSNAISRLPDSPCSHKIPIPIALGGV